MEIYSPYFWVLFDVWPVLFSHDVCTVACCRKVCFYCQPLTSHYENSMNVIDSIYIVLVVKCHWLYLHCACSWILLLSKNGLSAWDVRHEFFLPVNFPFLLKLMVNLSYHFCFFVYFHCAWGVRHADVLIMNYAYFYSSLFTLCLRPFPIYLGLYLHDFALLIIEWFGRCSSEIMIREALNWIYDRARLTF